MAVAAVLRDDQDGNPLAHLAGPEQRAPSSWTASTTPSLAARHSVNSPTRVAVTTISSRVEPVGMPEAAAATGRTATDSQPIRARMPRSNALTMMTNSAAALATPAAVEG